MSEYKILLTSDTLYSYISNTINELLRVSIFKKHETPYHIRAMAIAGFTAFKINYIHAQSYKPFKGLYYTHEPIFCVLFI